MTTGSYQYITESGTIQVDTSSTVATVNSWWLQALGADLVTDPSTVQGVFMTTEAIALNATINNNAALANQINPNIAGGVFLDSIGSLTGSARNVQKPTSVTLVAVTGAPTTVLPVGAQARTAAGDIFQLTQAVTIPSGGSTTGTFQSIAYGAIPCAENALNEIVTPILGWETVNNGSSSVTTLGSTTQSDQAFRAYRKNTLAFQALSLNAAITSALYAVPGVTSLSYRENYNSSPMGMIISVTGGVTLSGSVFALETEQGTGSGVNGSLVIDTDDLVFSRNGQTVPPVNPWPVAAFATTGNITLSGLGTQSGGDWGSDLTSGQIVLVQNQTTEIQNGLYFANSSTWTRQTYNTSGASILGSNDGISMIPNSVYACVAGGLATDIAAALLENKSSGSGWNGGTSTTVIEPASGQAYTVLYDVPIAIQILIEVTVTGATQAQVIKAILDYQAGTVSDPAGNPSNLSGFGVGQNISPFELAAAIAIENPGAYVSLVEIAPFSDSPSYSTSPIACALNAQGFTNTGSINVTVS